MKLLPSCKSVNPLQRSYLKGLISRESRWYSVPCAYRFTKVMKSPIKHGYATQCLYCQLALKVNDTRARVRIARTLTWSLLNKVWFPKLLSGSGNMDFRLNSAILHCVFWFPKKIVRIAVFPDKCIPDTRGFTEGWIAYAESLNYLSIVGF